ncbi:MAG: PKD domain-containing protein, partial [Flavobacteriaceae bacterium]|nr:PKD domain-containing protein [Flavobacteriaceae bacterium]
HYKADNFEMLEVRTHHGENRIQDASFAVGDDINLDSYYTASRFQNPPSRKFVSDTNERFDLEKTLEASKDYYKEYEAFEFEQMEPNEERNIFFSLKTTPEMLKDTSAIISVRSVYVPDGSYPNHKVKELEMEIVTSHDPNKMSSNATLMNYRLVRFKTFKFKIKFQNNGEGPASTIRLETDIPEMFDKQTIEVTDMYPECPICPDEREVNYSCLDTAYTDKQAIFTFKNIYLPGSEQKNVREYDSTKGFVKYKVKLQKDFHKQTTRSRTAIIFDKNDPIITNYATTRFMTGLSIGAKAGYSFRPGADRDLKEYFAGITFSPYKSYRGYLQAELMVGASSFDEISEFTEEEVVDDVFVNRYDYTEQIEGKNITLYGVPISYRYNLNNYAAVAGGVQLKVDLSQQTTTDSNGAYTLEIPSEGEVIRDESQDIRTRVEHDCSFVNFQAGVFAGFNVGFARIGPSVGARYVYYFNQPHQQVMLHAIWKF